MNTIQLILFLIFLGSALVYGAVWLRCLTAGREPDSFLNKWVWLGESLLLGSILIIGVMILFSIVHLYSRPWLWGVVLFGYGGLFLKNVRNDFLKVLSVPKISLPAAVFLILSAVFIFRNYYPMFDVDGMTNYMYAQKLWLANGTSVITSPGFNYAIYLPQFDAVPYALGLSVFPDETLFPQLVGIYWRMIVFILLFGYASYRFNGWYGLAAVMLTMFNDHIFYSGVNGNVIINGAIVALFLAAVINIWEGCRSQNIARMVLAVIFLSQVVMNKYQGIYTTIVLLVVLVWMCQNRWASLKEIFYNKRYLASIAAAGAFVFLWLMKNYLATGDPLFPALAGKTGALGWAVEQQHAFRAGYGGLTLTQILKYFNYLWIWPGIIAAKYVCLFITFFPVIVFTSLGKKDARASELREFGFWLFVSTIILMTICLTLHWDPRYYRYGIGVMAFAAIFGLRYVLMEIIQIKQPAVVIILILMLCGAKAAIVVRQGGGHQRPTFKENFLTLTDKVHTEYAARKSYPHFVALRDDLPDHPEQLRRGAYFATSHSNFAFFLLPVRPSVGVFRTNIVKWDSYGHPEQMTKDLKSFGIDWIITFNTDNTPHYVRVEDFVRQPEMEIDRHPGQIFHGYGFPEELRIVK